MNDPKEIISVLRVIEYEGDREWIARTLAKSLHGVYRITGTRITRSAVCGETPRHSDTCALDGYFDEADAIPTISESPNPPEQNHGP